MPNRLRHSTLRSFALHFAWISVMLCLAGWGPFDLFFTRTIATPRGNEQWVEQQMKYISSQAENIDNNVLKLGLIAYIHARDQGVTQQSLLTIIDYSKPSIERRLWVIDLKNAKVLFNTWVSHGKNSGKDNATSFSNQPGSLKSSIGVFKTTGHPYNGTYGYALRLIGLEDGINDKAFERAIVFHGAWYADPGVIKKYGSLGRSWGCPAVSEETVQPLINTIKDKTLVVVYYPDRNWLNHSAFFSS